LRRRGYALVDTRKHYAQDGLFTLHNDSFRGDAAFQAAYARGVAANRGVDPKFEWRVHTALWAARTALGVAGDFVECGVNAGFMSSAIMQHLDWAGLSRRFYLIDTFRGPSIGQFSSAETAKHRVQVAEDAIAAGSYVTDVGRVRNNFAQWPNAVVVPGEIPGVLATLAVEAVAFLHIDMNCALPERAALEFFWPLLAPGGIVLLDDYAYSGHECQAAAILEAAAGLGTRVLSLPTGQGMIVKG